MRYPTPHPYIHTDGELPRLRDVFIPIAGVIALSAVAFNTLHFSNKRNTENVLREHGYTAIDIQEGPSWRRDDCNSLSLTHYRATDKNGVRREGALCLPAFGGGKIPSE